VSLALCATSEGILDREAPAHAVIRQPPSPPNGEETHMFRDWCEKTDHQGLNRNHFYERLRAVIGEEKKDNDGHWGWTAP
jgi:hypothetical protein